MYCDYLSIYTKAFLSSSPDASRPAVATAAIWASLERLTSVSKKVLKPITEEASSHVLPLSTLLALCFELLLCRLARSVVEGLGGGGGDSAFVGLCSVFWLPGPFFLVTIIWEIGCGGSISNSDEGMPSSASWVRVGVGVGVGVRVKVGARVRVRV